MAKLESKYSRRIGKEVVDVYDVLMAFNVTNPATQHATRNQEAVDAWQSRPQG